MVRSTTNTEKLTGPMGMGFCNGLSVFTNSALLFFQCIFYLPKAKTISFVNIFHIWICLTHHSLQCRMLDKIQLKNKSFDKAKLF